MSARDARESRLRVVVPAAILAITAAIFLPALSFGFVCDDGDQIVSMQPRYVWSALPSYFTSDVWSYSFFVKTNYYRPGFLTWLLLNSRLFGLNTMLWHAAAIALHLTATLLLYFLARRITGDFAVAGAAALLFGVHPAHVEAVAWVSGATEPLFACLAISAILCQIRGWRAGALLLFGAALFTKETAIVLPFLLAACDWMFPGAAEANRKQQLRSAASTLVMCFLVLLVYVGMRLHALGSFAPLLRVWTPRMLIATAPSVLVFYLRQLLVPMEYSLFYPIAPIATFGWKATVEPLLILTAAAVALIWLARRSRTFAFAALLLVVPLLPVLNFRAFAFDDFQHDRYVYLPSAGLCLLIALAGARFIRLSMIRAVLLAGAAGALAYVTLESSSVWSDNLSLYSHAVEVAPNSTIASEYLGNEMLVEQRYTDALPLFQKALQQDDRMSVYENVALCYLGLEDYAQATAFLWRAIGMHPSAYAPHFYLGEVEKRQGRLAQAEAEFREAIRLRPQASPLLADYHGKLAQVLAMEENWTGALAEYQAELAENPDSEEARDSLRDLQQRLLNSAPDPQPPITQK